MPNANVREVLESEYLRLKESAEAVREAMELLDEQPMREERSCPVDEDHVCETIRFAISDEERKLDALNKALAAITGAAPAPSASNLDIRPTDFQGMNIAGAVIKLLTMLGHPETNENMLPLLLKGGCNLGKQKERFTRTLRITMRMNSKPTNPLRYDPNTDLVGLRLWDHQRAART